MNDFSQFDTEQRRAAQAACRHLIHCAVDEVTRRQVSAAIEYARTVGDVRALPILLAQLTGPCHIAASQAHQAGVGDTPPTN